MEFYSTFGGLNNSLGTASTFVLEVDPEGTEIYFSRPNGGYEVVVRQEVEKTVINDPYFILSIS